MLSPRFPRSATPLSLRIPWPWAEGQRERFSRYAHPPLDGSRDWVIDGAWTWAVVSHLAANEGEQGSEQAHPQNSQSL